MSSGAHPAAPPSPLRRRLLPLALAGTVLLAYAGSLAGDFLAYDDSWLVTGNAVLRDPAPSRLVTVWTDLAPATRLALGAEYLPVRDTLVWLELRVLGASAAGFRVVSLALYLAAALLLRRWLHRLDLEPRVAEGAAWLFALHPVHAESVAWVAGQKDVLALLLTALALGAYASERPRVRLLTPVCALAASLSKGVSVVLPLLLAISDLAARRRPDWRALAPAAALAAGVAALQAHVGTSVGLFAPPHGGSRLATLATMGPVLWRYLGLSTGAVAPALVHEPRLYGPGDGVAWLAWAALAALVSLAALAWRRGERTPLVGAAWFAVALAPVSQVVAPLQHLMADRYLLLAVLGPCLVIAWAIVRLLGRAPGWAAALGLGALVSLAAAGTLYRAVLFSDAAALWADETQRSERAPLAPYQLALTLEAAGRPREAELAYREAARRDGFRTETGRRAVNNLARLLAGTGRADEAITLYRRAVRAWPADPKVRWNLAELLARRGDDAEARRLCHELVTRFPAYRRGREGCDRRYPRAAAAPP